MYLFLWDLVLIIKCRNWTLSKFLINKKIEMVNKLISSHIRVSIQTFKAPHLLQLSIISSQFFWSSNRAIPNSSLIHIFVIKIFSQQKTGIKPMYVTLQGDRDFWNLLNLGCERLMENDLREQARSFEHYFWVAFLINCSEMISLTLTRSVRTGIKIQ